MAESWLGPAISALQGAVPSDRRGTAQALEIILHMMILREKALQVTKILEFAKRFLFFGILKGGWF